MTHINIRMFERQELTIRFYRDLEMTHFLASLSVSAFCNALMCLHK